MAKANRPAQVEDVRAELRRVEDRVGASEQLVRTLVKIQAGQLADAEKLRRLALAAVDARDESPAHFAPAKYHRAVNVLEAFVRTLSPFHNPEAGEAPKPRKGKRK